MKNIIIIMMEKHCCKEEWYNKLSRDFPIQTDHKISNDQVHIIAKQKSTI